jgi:hypothetical protein
VPPRALRGLNTTPAITKTSNWSQALRIPKLIPYIAVAQPNQIPSPILFISGEASALTGNIN